jgi:hypothetical protein
MPDTINAKDRGSRCPRVSKMTVGKPPVTFACDGSAKAAPAAVKSPESGPKPSDAFVSKPRTTSATLPEPTGSILRQRAANPKATVLCNPVVFGLVDVKNNQPLCVEPSASVTKTCAEKSKAQELKVAEMIKKYPEEYRVVTSRVNTLCTGDKEVLKSHFKSMGITDARQIENSVNDLGQTCDILNVQLREVSGKYESSGQASGKQ